MNTLSPGKFEIRMGGEDRVVLVSLGLKSQLYKILTKAQIGMAKLGENVQMDVELAARIREGEAELGKLRDAEAAEEEIEAQQQAVNVLYEEALLDLERRQSEELEKIALRKIELSEEILCEAIACLLSERDECGKVTKPLTTDQIMWSEEFSEAQDELLDLVNAVVDYLTSALKKISVANRMINEFSEAAVREKSLEKSSSS